MNNNLIANLQAIVSSIIISCSGFVALFLSVFIASRIIKSYNRAACRRKNRKRITEYSDGKKYCNVLEITTEKGEHIKIKGYSNAQHTVDTFAESCDKVMCSDDGITIYSEKECSFFPMGKVRVIVENKKI